MAPWIPSSRLRKAKGEGIIYESLEDLLEFLQRNLLLLIDDELLSVEKRRGNEEDWSILNFGLVFLHLFGGFYYRVALPYTVRIRGDSFGFCAFFVNS